MSWLAYVCKTKAASYRIFVNAILLISTITWILIIYFYSEIILNKNENVEDFDFSAFSTKTKATEPLNQYFLIHESILNSRENSSKRIMFNGDSNGILKGSPKGGYGNRLNSVISSILIAILLDTQINIKWQHIDTYISTPIKSLFDISLSENEGLSFVNFRMSSFHFKGKQAYWPQKSFEILSQTHLPTNYKRYFLEYADPFFMEICSNSLYFEKILYYNLASLEALNQALNSSNSDKMEAHFRVGFEVGGNLLNRIWKPSQALQREIDAYLDSYFNKTEYFIIGFQLRYGSKWTKEHQSDGIFLDDENYLDTLKFINCALAIENEYLMKNKGNKLKKFKWFVATDLESQLSKLSQEYPDKIISASGKIAHVHFESEAYKRAIMDIELLSKCDELIITGGSTFGWIPSMKSLKPPFYINGLSNMRKCERVNFSRPPLMPTGAAVF